MSKPFGVRYRNFIVASILVLFVVATYFLSLRLISQLHFHKAKNHLRDNHYGLAISRLEKAIHYNDNDFTTWNHLGRAYHELGLLKPPEKAFRVAEKSKQAYLKAAQLNQNDAEAAFGLAREEARLEQLYAYMHPDKDDNPYHALPYYEEAIRLRPNGISYHYAVARYLHKQGRTEALLPIVTNLARIYPLAYSHLKKEAFWSPKVKEAVKKGFGQAIEEGRAPERAHIQMSSLLREEQDWAGAISHYKKALALQTGDEQSAGYLHLGHLYLEDGRFKEAEESFLKALSMSQNREKDLEGLYGVYQRKGYSEELFRFYERVNRIVPQSAQTDIILARTLIDLEQYDLGRQILNELNAKEPHAAAHYWLYRVAEKEKDWDQMELSIQKATVLDPKNSQYHLLFSQVLDRMKKLDSAEQEAGLAIDHSAKPSAGLFNHRASVRWTKKDYQGALRDWKSALALQPRNASLHAQMAEAYLKIGEGPSAIRHYQTALQLSPNNEAYKVKLEALRGTQAGDAK
jgi:tetratricopeptide (TPR) repeat protein